MFENETMFCETVLNEHIRK